MDEEHFYANDDHCPTCGAPDGWDHLANCDYEPEEECDPLDDVQDHHDWDYSVYPLGVCSRCGALSQSWEE